MQYWNVLGVFVSFLCFVINKKGTCIPIPGTDISRSDNYISPLDSFKMLLGKKENSNQEETLNSIVSDQQNSELSRPERVYGSRTHELPTEYPMSTSTTEGTKILRVSFRRRKSLIHDLDKRSKTVP